MKKQFKDNHELDTFLRKYARTHYDMSNDYFASRFKDFLPSASNYMTIEEQMNVVIDSGYTLDNLRSTIKSSYLEVYDRLLKERME